MQPGRFWSSGTHAYNSLLHLGFCFSDSSCCCSLVRYSSAGLAVGHCAHTPLLDHPSNQLPARSPSQPASQTASQPASTPHGTYHVYSNFSATKKLQTLETLNTVITLSALFALFYCLFNYSIKLIYCIISHFWLYYILLYVIILYYSFMTID